MSGVTFEAPDDPVSDPSALSSSSRGRFLLHSAAIAAAACLPRAVWGAGTVQVNPSAPPVRAEEIQP
jgi:hypothetical protein